MKAGTPFKRPTIDVQESGTVVIDVGALRKLARSCSVYAIGKMLCRHGVPIREACRILDRLKDKFMDEGHSVTFLWERYENNYHGYQSWLTKLPVTPQLDWVFSRATRHEGMVVLQ